MTRREIAKAAAHAAAVVLVSPAIVSFAVRRRLLGADRALEGSTQALAWVPGLVGQYVRRAFLVHALDHCARSAVVEFGTIFSSSRARLDDHAYLGPRCHIGFAHVGADALLGAGVHVPSGGRTHAFGSSAVPIRDQEGERTLVHIGAGSWIGSAAVVMADVGAGTIVGAGAVVTRALPPGVVAGGVPARVIRTRAGREPEQS